MVVNVYNPRPWYKPDSPMKVGRYTQCYLQCYLQLHTEFEINLRCGKYLKSKQTKLTVLTPKNLIAGPGEKLSVRMLFKDLQSSGFHIYPLKVFSIKEKELEGSSVVKNTCCF